MMPVEQATGVPVRHCLPRIEEEGAYFSVLIDIELPVADCRLQRSCDLLVPTSL